MKQLNYVTIGQDDVMTMGSGKNVVNVNSQGYNWHHEWYKALNALDYYSYRYKYFYLENPPINEGEDKAGDKYDSVQERIRSNVESLVALFEGERYNQQLKDHLREFLNFAKWDAIWEETALAKQFQDLENGNSIYNGYTYEMLVENTKPLNITPVYNTIEYWTRKMFPEEIKVGKGLQWDSKGIQNPELAFSLIVGSKEFYDLFKLKTEKQMTKYFQEMMDAENNKKRTKVENYEQNITVIFADFSTYVAKNLSRELGNSVLNELYKAFENVNGKNINAPWGRMEIHTAPGRPQWVERYDPSFDVQVDDKDFKVIMLRLQNLLRKTNSEILNAGYDLAKGSGYITDKKGFTLQLPNGFQLDDNGNIILTKQANIQVDKNGQPSIRIKHRIIGDVFYGIREAMYALEIYMKEGKSLSLNSLSLGIINFDNDVGLIQQLFYYGRMYLDRIESMLSQGIQRNQNLWKSFLARRSSAWFSGLFGELTGMVNFAHLFERFGYRVKLTGATEAHINGSGLGGSVNDLILSKKYKNEIDGKTHISRFGVNIKHYTKQTGKNFKLYGKAGTNGLFADTTAKYLKAWQLNAARFVLANSNYFEGENADRKISMEDIIFKIALGSIPQYLRISDRTRSSADNLFFQINNVIYPTSYIYDCALDQLDRLISRTNDKDAFINIKIEEEGLDEGKSYKNLVNARRYWKDKNFRLSTSEKPKGKNAKVGTNGITINLVSL